MLKHKLRCTPQSRDIPTENLLDGGYSPLNQARFPLPQPLDSGLYSLVEMLESHFSEELSAEQTRF
jgi:hypothetical protein